ncbi:hypothetical protein ACJ72_06112 [Emergomyces africanus]|uniref:Uncharacterized protein n=1 Tax=Emergomyces africanus TaxID=1955775 RepID=A0A1B7NS15_9EURO|nr:hypothetical protein ACJ72_06112 [Emergomyces africanus]
MSAAVPYRLVIPLSGSHMFRFSHLTQDPNELDPLERWSLDELTKAVNRTHGQEAAKWAAEADSIGRWWAAEMRRFDRTVAMT